MFWKKSSFVFPNKKGSVNARMKLAGSGKIVVEDNIPAGETTTGDTEVQSLYRATQSFNPRVEQMAKER